MCRFLPFLLVTLTLSAQPPALDKPPQDVDDALRARVKQFYDYTVARKFRLCETLIAEESKDDFYVMNKPQMDRYRVSNIEYSDNFTKAKVIIVGAVPVMFPGAAPTVMDQPIASYWTRKSGVWLWYYYKKAGVSAPIGPKESPEQMIASLQSAVKIDRTSVDLAAGKPQTVKLTNTLPGPASLSIECPLMPIAKTGIKATFDKKELKGNETATLTLSADPTGSSGPCPLRIIVTPTNQVLELTVNVTR